METHYFWAFFIVALLVGAGFTLAYTSYRSTVTGNAFWNPFRAKEKLPAPDHVMPWPESQQTTTTTTSEESNVSGESNVSNLMLYVEDFGTGIRICVNKDNECDARAAICGLPVKNEYVNEYIDAYGNIWADYGCITNGNGTPITNCSNSYFRTKCEELCNQTTDYKECDGNMKTGKFTGGYMPVNDWCDKGTVVTVGGEGNWSLSGSPYCSTEMDKCACHCETDSKEYMIEYPVGAPKGKYCVDLQKVISKEVKPYDPRVIDAFICKIKGGATCNK